ncbi:uncharacterized protein [Onthophagus taurus]|uniref:uncharacterized protein isoform X2 n=1 Tax=Onthophagus taurus TaxID=166361 RepID=UPI0039BE32C9
MNSKSTSVQNAYNRVDLTSILRTNEQYRKQRRLHNSENRRSRSMDDIASFVIEEKPPSKRWGNLKKSKSVCIRRKNLSDQQRIEELIKKHRATEILDKCTEFDQKHSNSPTRPKPAKFPAIPDDGIGGVELRRSESSSNRKEYAQTIHETTNSIKGFTKGPYKLKGDNNTKLKVDNGKIEIGEHQIQFFSNDCLLRTEMVEGKVEIEKHQITYKTKDGIRTVVFKNPIRNQDSILADSRNFLRKFLRRRSDKHLLEKKGILKNENVFGNKLPVLRDRFEGNAVPPFVKKIMALIEQEDNIKTEYIYRISGNMAVIQKIRLQIDENNIKILDKHVKDVEVLTGTLKLFYRELVDPVLPHKDFEKLNKIMENTKLSPNERSTQVIETINEIESPFKENLKELIEHLLKIESNSSYNKMTLQSLAIVWGPSLIWYQQDKNPDPGYNAVNFSLLANKVVEMIFVSYKMDLQQLTSSEFRGEETKIKEDLAMVPEEKVIERQFSEEGTTKNTMASFVGGIFGLKKTESKEALFGSSWSLSSFGSESKKVNDNPFYDYPFESLPKRENESIPWVVCDILKVLEGKVGTKDLYITSSSKEYMNKFKRRISKKNPDISKMEPLDLAIILLKILKELNDKLVPEEIFLDYCDNYERLTSDQRKRLVETHLENLPKDRKLTLEKIMEHLFNMFQHPNTNRNAIGNVWLPIFCCTTKISDHSLTFTRLIFNYYEQKLFPNAIPISNLENKAENKNINKPFEYQVKIRNEEGEWKTTYSETTTTTSMQNKIPTKEDVKNNFSNAQLNSIANSMGKNVQGLNKYSTKWRNVGAEKKS